MTNNKQIINFELLQTIYNDPTVQLHTKNIQSICDISSFINQLPNELYDKFMLNYFFLINKSLYDMIKYVLINGRCYYDLKKKIIVNTKEENRTYYDMEFFSTNQYEGWGPLFCLAHDYYLFVVCKQTTAMSLFNTTRDRVFTCANKREVPESLLYDEHLVGAGLDDVRMNRSKINYVETNEVDKQMIKNVLNYINSTNMPVLDYASTFQTHFGNKIGVAYAVNQVSTTYKVMCTVIWKERVFNLFGKQQVMNNAHQQDNIIDPFFYRNFILCTELLLKQILP